MEKPKCFGSYSSAAGTPCRTCLVFWECKLVKDAPKEVKAKRQRKPKVETEPEKVETEESE